MPCNRKVPILGDLDTAFGYSVPRLVFIKDGYIGSSYWTLVLGAIVVLLVKFCLWDKAYMKLGAISGVARIQPLAPYPAWSASSLNLPLPYCDDDSIDSPNPLSSGGTFAVTPTTYRYNTTPSSPRYPCLALDDKWAVSNPLDPTGVFIPTRIVQYTQSAPACSLTGTHPSPPGGAVDRPILNTTVSSCTYTNSSPLTSYYIPDVEAYTLKIDHQLSVPSLGLAFSKDQMYLGTLQGVGGQAIDPCAFYAQRSSTLPCPLNTQPNPNATNYISIGLTNVPDILAVGTLLQAAGVTLDDASYPAIESMRYGGVTLLVSVVYDNFWATGTDGHLKVKYTYTVQAIKGKVKGIFGVSPTGSIPHPTRDVFERSGLKVILTYSGNVGAPDVFTGFIGLMSILQATVVAGVLTSLIISHGLQLSPVYKRYITTQTYELPSEAKAIKTVTKLFKEDAHILHPPPPKISRTLSLGVHKGEGGNGEGVYNNIQPAHSKINALFSSIRASTSSTSGVAGPQG